MLWHQPDLALAIVHASQERDWAALKATCVALACAVDRPTLWARRYAPCRIDPRNHRITTCLQLNLGDGGGAVQSRRLGQHTGQPWTLHGGYRPVLPKDMRLLALLDEAAELLRLQARADGMEPLAPHGGAPSIGDGSHRLATWYQLLTMGYRLRMGGAIDPPVRVCDVESMLCSPGCMLGALVLWSAAALALRYHDARACGAPVPVVLAATLTAASPEAASLVVVLTCLAMHTNQQRAERNASGRLKAIARTVHDAARGAPG